MDKLAKDLVRNRYYNLGVQAAIDNSNTKTAANIKDIARSLGKGTSYALPTLGGLGGLLGGGYLGGSAGLHMAESIAEHAASQGDAAGELSSIILGSALLGGGGLGLGAAIGGKGGHSLGTSAKDSLLRALQKNK